MFCPNCKDEFRQGFTRCEGCGVDLVDDLSAKPPQAEAHAEAPPAGPVPMADFCGFIELDEARGARETLRAEGIRSEIAIRDAPETTPSGRIVEEFWLRIEVNGYKRATSLLGLDTVEDSGEADSTITCPRCETVTQAAESFCPSCGEKFEVH